MTAPIDYFPQSMARVLLRRVKKLAKRAIADLVDAVSKLVATQSAINLRRAS